MIVHQGNQILINMDNAAEVCNWCWISWLLSSWGFQDQTCVSKLLCLSWNLCPCWASFRAVVDWSRRSEIKQAVPRTQACEQNRPDKLDVAAGKAVSSKSYWQLAHRLPAVRAHTHAQTLTGDQDQWQDASEALLCLHSPPLHTTSSLPICHYPEVLGTVTRGPQGPKSLSYNDNWPLTACLRGITTPHLYVFIPLHTVSAHSLLFFYFFFFFYFVSLLPTTLCDSGCWLRQSPLKLAVPVSPLFGSDPKAGDSHQAAERLQPPQRMLWRTASGLLCAGLMC